MFCGGGPDNPKGALTLNDIQGSNDTSNGKDGTWETAVLPSGSPGLNDINAYSWREHIKAVSFSEPKKL